MRESKYDVAVVGGGVIGLSSAFALAYAGRRVVVFDEHVARGSSFAAAGMLAPGAESTPEHAHFTAASLVARRQWPDFAKFLSKASGCQVLVHDVGSLFVGWDASDRREHERYFAAARHQGIVDDVVSRADDDRKFVGITSTIDRGHLVREDAFVDTDLVLAALVSGLLALGGVVIRERVRACDSVPSGAVVHTVSGAYFAGCGIIATGFPLTPLAATDEFDEHLRPIRGVSLRLRMPAGDCAPMIRGLVQGRMVYIVRRSDGVVVVGATSDETPELIAGAGAVRRLLDDARTLLPALDNAEFVESRVGLRPVSSNQLPFFLSHDVLPWAWSGGHYRHGFLMAPTAAEKAVDFSERFEI